MNIKDVQLLLYLSPEMFEPCVAFYEKVFDVTSFYGWDEGENDRGSKYKIGPLTLVVLAQEKPFEDEPSVPVNFQIEVEDIDAFYAHVSSAAPDAITHTLFTRPYGWRMFRINDPAGNHINLYQIPNN